jgi:hypothetical protein
MNLRSGSTIPAFRHHVTISTSSSQDGRDFSGAVSVVFSSVGNRMTNMEVCLFPFFPDDFSSQYCIMYIKPCALPMLFFHYMAMKIVFLLINVMSVYFNRLTQNLRTVQHYIRRHVAIIVRRHTVAFYTDCLVNTDGLQTLMLYN